MLRHKIYHEGRLAKAVGLVTIQYQGEQDWAIRLRPLAESERAAPS
jgi:hypothetical protein